MNAVFDVPGCLDSTAAVGVFAVLVASFLVGFAAFAPVVAAVVRVAVSTAAAPAVVVVASLGFFVVAAAVTAVVAIVAAAVVVFVLFLWQFFVPLFRQWSRFGF